MSILARIRPYLGPLALSVGLLLAGEAILRLLGHPHGTFEAFVAVGGDFYPPNRIIEAGWGAIPYEIRTNDFGLRGEAIAAQPGPGTRRILTIGDSVTAGFFVDNEDTWQYRLEELLQDGRSEPVEVVNCARSGGSIDRQLRKLTKCLSLQPQLVILTFVTNDIDELERSQISLPMIDEIRDERAGAAQAVGQALTRIALAEFIFENYLRWRSPELRENDAKPNQSAGTGEAMGLDPRYDIQGSREFEENARRFEERFRGTDCRLLRDSLDPEITAILDDYIDLLEEVRRQCRQAGASLLFVYFPAYPQVYRPGAPRTINRRLERACARLGIEFLDLTDGFIEAGRNQVLYLAPVDFHLNPGGNRVFATLVAKRIRDWWRRDLPGGTKDSQ